MKITVLCLSICVLICTASPLTSSSENNWTSVEGRLKQGVSRSNNEARLNFVIRKAEINVKQVKDVVRKAKNAVESNSSDDKIPTNVRIVNGESVKSRKEFPFVVDLSESDTAISSRRFCTGTLIDRTTVLTAAHCVINQGYRAPVYATIGRVQLEDGHKDNQPSMTYRTVASMVHPEYQGIGSKYDAAVMLLNSSCETTTPVSLAEQSPPKDSLTWVVGYGIQTIGTLEETGRPIEILAGRLQKTQLRIVPRSECDVPQAHLFTEEGLLCTKGVKIGASACMGDSGGGLFSVNPENPDEKIQVGIVSYGDSQCSSEDSGVFTDVSNVYQWIRHASSRLHSLVHATPLELHLDDSNLGSSVIHNDHIGGKNLMSLNRHVEHNHRDQHNVKYYDVKTDFSKPTDVKVSLCDTMKIASAKSLILRSQGAALSVRVQNHKQMLSDHGSCGNGKLSQLIVPALKKDQFTVGISTNSTLPVRLTLSVQASN